MHLNSATVERYGPLALAVVAAIAWWYFDMAVSAAIAKELIAALLAAASIAAGFLTTALSILLTLLDSAMMRQLRRSGYDAEVYEFIRSAIHGCLLLAALCIAAFFFYRESLPRWIEVALVGQTVYAAAALLRISEGLLNLFRRALQKDEDPH